MSFTTGVKKFFNLIGLVDESNAEEEHPRSAGGYEQAGNTYEEPRYTPRRRTQAPERERQQDDRRYAAPGRRPNNAQSGAYQRRDPYSNETYSQNSSAPVAPNKSMRTSPGTMVYYLHSLSECGAVIEDLIYGRSVLLNLEDTDSVLTQRIVDTLAGATFALRAKIRKVSEKMYLIAPENVEVNMTRSVERRY